MGTALTYEAVDASSTPEQASYMYFDTPSTTSQITYKVGFNHSQSSTISWHLNKCVTDSDDVNQERGMSLICNRDSWIGDWMALIKLNNQSLANITSAGLPSGTVLQVQSSVQTGSSIGQTGTTFTASGHTVTITPASSANKILIMLQGGNQFQDTSSDSIDVAMYYKDGTAAYTK